MTHRHRAIAALSCAAALAATAWIPVEVAPVTGAPPAFDPLNPPVCIDTPMWDGEPITQPLIDQPPYPRAKQPLWRVASWWLRHQALPANPYQ